MLYDRAVINQISDERFRPQGWPHAEAVGGELRSGGRGNTAFVGNVPRQFVLRHYLRGGLVGKLVRDLYVYSGEDEVRSFREWRLLKKLVDFGLRVPRPAAARYRRYGPFYTADLITVRLPGVKSLSIFIKDEQDAEFWSALGAAIHEFHSHGVFHADMNAYNLQIDDEKQLWMLDFDKGRLRQPGTWQQDTLRRLHRSLIKVKTLDPRLHFVESDWEALLEGYFNASRSA
jgi:3-deoxy-D-manno-octulosonic acid kinase